MTQGHNDTMRNSSKANAEAQMNQIKKNLNGKDAVERRVDAAFDHRPFEHDRLVVEHQLGLAAGEEHLRDDPARVAQHAAAQKKLYVKGWRV